MRASLRESMREGGDAAFRYEMFSRRLHAAEYGRPEALNWALELEAEMLRDGSIQDLTEIVGSADVHEEVSPAPPAVADSLLETHRPEQSEAVGDDARALMPGHGAEAENQGWAPIHADGVDLEIQRDDEAGIFEDDDAAAAFVANEAVARPDSAAAAALAILRSEAPTEHARIRALVVDATASERPDAEVVPTVSAAAAANYVITDADELGVGGAKTKFKDNMAALRTLRALRSEGRQATAQEQAVLARYVGWGGIPQAFDGNNESWRKEFDELAGVLHGTAYEAARRSTQDAHYTSGTIVRGIHAGLHRLGARGGEWLEPAVGTGNFIGMLPDAQRDARVTGIELDPVTAEIAVHLYPQARIINKGMQEVMIPNDHFDVVVGNPPFGSQSVYDPHHREISRFSIHNYFLAKSIDKLRPGGVMATVVSHSFMDAQDAAAREFIADRAHLVGAIRLPNTAFKQNANTDVTTDIVFFQKALPGQETDRSWTKVGAVVDRESGDDIPLNQYFIDKPSMMLGTMSLVGSMYRAGTPTCEPHDGEDLQVALSAAVAALPSDVYVEREAPAPALAVPAAAMPKVIPEDVKIGAYYVAEGNRLARRLPDLMDEPLAEWLEAKSEKAAERVRSMIGLRTCLRSLMATERSEYARDEDVDAMRAELNRVYDQFVKKHGHVSSLANRQALSDDPDFPLLHSLERDYDKGISKESAKRHGVEAREASALKADIFTRRVMKPVREITEVATAKDALVVSMNEAGRVDIPLMATLRGVTSEALVAELDGLVFHDPSTGNWETADKYLSGNVKAKLAAAHDAAAGDPALRANVAALEKVQPAPIEAVDIGIQLGATWVPPRVVDQFVGHLLGENVRRNVSYQPALGKWVAKIGPGDHTTCTVTWGTKEAPANTLIASILENRTIQVRDIVSYEDGRPVYAVNENETAAANQKADEVRQAFVDWVWEDKDRRGELAKIYNETFNTNVIPKYDGSHLTLPGASATVSLRSHQKDAIWRGIQEGSTLFDHVVGAGKTFVKIGVAMESRRMGLLQKPMLAVPNHLLLQWKDAFYTLYPNAKVLVAEKSDFKKENREKLFAKIATGDWDAVIVGHSSLKKIGMPPETLQAILNEQVEDLSRAILELKKERGDRVTIKEMEKAKDRMKAKLDRISDTGTKDRVVTFDELGVDALLVDEMHEFKNLFITTSLSRIAGLGNLAGSDKAFDLFVKCRYLQEKYEGRGVYGGTGTPISNTIAELYTVQRYMRYDDMKSRGIHHFDAWASAFGQVVTGWELDATGVNYRLNSRFAKFQNVPELIGMYRTFGDVITRQDLEEQAAARGTRFPVPKIKGGRPTNVIVQRSPAQANFMGVQTPVLDGEGKPVLREGGLPVMQWNEGSIIHRMENLPKDPSKDNPLKVTNDARKAGLDYRLIEPGAADFAGSKVNAMVDHAVRIYEEWNDRKGTQMIFCDLSTPKLKTAARAAVVVPEAGAELEDREEEVASVSMDEILAGGSSFSVYEDIKAKLIARGVPADEIRFIHEANSDLQKQKLFDQVNRGEVRFLLGSTAKMGAGTNAQRLLVAKHDLDCPWRPSDLEQRDGRIVRQGNHFYEQDPDGFEVELLRYATKQTYDSRMWQTVEVKAAGIEQFRRGDTLVRVIEDIAGEAANAAEMKAAATGNPLIFMQVRLQADLKKMEALASNFKRNQHSIEHRVAWLEGEDARADTILGKARSNIALRDAGTTAKWQFKVGRHVFTNESKEGMLHSVMACMKSAAEGRAKTRREESMVIPVGEYRGFRVSVYTVDDIMHFTLKSPYSERDSSNLWYSKSDDFSVTGFIQRMDNTLKGFEAEIIDAESSRRKAHDEIVKARAEAGKPFPQQDKLEALRKDAADVMTELKKIQANPDYVSTWSPASDKAAVVDQRAKDARAELRAEVSALGLNALQANEARGIYTGEVIHVSADFIAQSVGMQNAVVHRRAALDGLGDAKVGAAFRVTYQDGRGHVHPRDESQHQR